MVKRVTPIGRNTNEENVAYRRTRRTCNILEEPRFEKTINFFSEKYAVNKLLIALTIYFLEKEYFYEDFASEIQNKSKALTKECVKEIAESLNVEFHEKPSKLAELESKKFSLASVPLILKEYLKIFSEQKKKSVKSIKFLEFIEARISAEFTNLIEHYYNLNERKHILKSELRRKSIQEAMNFLIKNNLTVDELNLLIELLRENPVFK